jgi:hypothetical protein
MKKHLREKKKEKQRSRKLKKLLRILRQRLKMGESIKDILHENN